MENNKKDETAPTKPMREPFVDAAYGGAYAPTYIPPAGTRRARPCTCPDLLQTSEAFARFNAANHAYFLLEAGHVATKRAKRAAVVAKKRAVKGPMDKWFASKTSSK